MSSTSEALVQLAQQKEALRVIANRYLAQGDKLAVDCTLQDIIDVLDEYDEYTYMNAFLNSIEVFPDKDYSINDTQGHIKGLRASMFVGNTALKSVFLPSVQALYGATFSGCSNLEKVKLPNVVSATQNYDFQNCIKIVNLELPNLDYVPSNLCAGMSLLSTILFGNTDITTNNAINGFPSSMSAVVYANATSVPTLSASGNVSKLQSIAGYTYVPSSLLSSFQTATNWVSVYQAKTDGQGNYNGIQAIEPNINDLRTLGVDFSYTPYANKKWENNQLVTDSTIGEVTV